MNKKNRIAKKVIKYKHLDETMYNLDKFFKLSKVKITNMDYIKSVDGGSKYRIRYKYGLNKLNPLTWVYIFIIISIETVIYLKDEVPSLVKMDSYSDFIKIKEDLNE